MKKLPALISIMLCFMLAAVCACCAASTEDTQTAGLACAAHSPAKHAWGDFVYVLMDDGTAMITGYYGNDMMLTIPESFDDIPVTAIAGGAFADKDSLVSIAIPDSVTSVGSNPFIHCYLLTDIIVSPSHPTLSFIDGTLFDRTESRLVCCTYAAAVADYVIPDGTAVIGDDAFYSCSRLTSVVIPESVTYIGSTAFYECNGLTSITIPDSVVSMGVNPFAECAALTDIIVSPSHPALETIDGALFDKNEKHLICYPYAFTAETYAVPEGVKSVGSWAFSRCGALTSVTLPDSVIYIGSSAFRYCRNLISINLPGSLTHIGAWAFNDCRSLPSITIPDSVTYIGDGAFYFCNLLTSITIPDSVTHIGTNPFVGCVKLTDIVISEAHPTLEIIDGALFDRTEARLVCLPCALENKSYAVPEGTAVIGDYAFYACSALTEVSIPDSVKYIGDGAFYVCESLTSINIPDGVSCIGDGMFSYCDNLVSVSIPDGVTCIGEAAFCDCRMLETLALPESVIHIGDWAFSECEALASLNIPGGTEYIGFYAFKSCFSVTLTVESDSPALEYAVRSKIPHTVSPD